MGVFRVCVYLLIFLFCVVVKNWDLIAMNVSVLLWFYSKVSLAK